MLVEAILEEDLLCITGRLATRRAKWLRMKACPVDFLRGQVDMNVKAYPEDETRADLLLRHLGR